MKILSKLLLSSMLLSSSLLAQVIPTEDMATNSLNSTFEFQFFVTHSRGDVDLKGLDSKIIFQGEIEDYYEFYETRMEKNTQLLLKSNLAEIGLQSASGGISNAISSGAGGSDPVGMIATMGIGVVINQLAVTFDTDDTYIQITDFYDKSGNPVNRMSKMIVAEDDLDGDGELTAVFNTSNDQSYHYVNATIENITEEGQ